jgi:hypothetical protein
LFILRECFSLKIHERVQPIRVSNERGRKIEIVWNNRRRMKISWQIVFWFCTKKYSTGTPIALWVKGNALHLQSFSL